MFSNSRFIHFYLFYLVNILINAETKRFSPSNYQKPKNYYLRNEIFSRQPWHNSPPGTHFYFI